jgi:hypothetical protein
LKPLILSALMLALLSACGSESDHRSQLRADGQYPINNLGEAAANAIISACRNPKGAPDSQLSEGECRLVVAGAAIRESSWDVNKSCEAWGAPDDPACGLTQSRYSDAQAVGLDCSPGEHSDHGYHCNALTGLRNLRCKADSGVSCDRWGSGRTLEVGIRKHLGSPNQGVLDSYRYDMQVVYLREDVRQRLWIDASSVRGWDVLLAAPQG